MFYLIVCWLSFKVSQSKDFRDVEIDDKLLENILEYPTKAFEIHHESKTDKKKLVLKGEFSKTKADEWDYETQIKLQGRIQPNMKRMKPGTRFLTTLCGIISYMQICHLNIDNY